MALTREQAEILLSATQDNRALAIAEKAKKGRTLTRADQAYLQSIAAGIPESGPDYVTTLADLARTLGTTRQRLNYHRRQRGFPKPDDANRYVRADVLAYARKAGLLGTPSPPSDGGEGRGEGLPPSTDLPDLYTERALLAREQRLTAEMNRRKEAATLLDAAAVAHAWDLIKANVRQRILAVGPKIESQCDLPPEQRNALRKLLDREIDDALSDLARPPDYQLDAT